MNVQREQRKRKDGPKPKRKIQGATRLAALGRFLVGDSLLLTHGRDDSDEQILALIEVGLDLLAKVALRKLDVVLGGTILGHEVEETVIDVDLREKGAVNTCIRDCFGALGRTSWYSVRKTLGTSMLWVEGEISSCKPP